MNNEVRKFTFDVWYFKPSGKFYASGKFNLETANCGTSEHPIAYMHTAVDYLEELRASGNPMPGLMGSWKNGCIVVNCEDGFPVLINPLVKETT